MRYGTSAGAVLLIIWLVIGAVAAGQRGYYDRSEANCATIGSTVVTIVVGPLNYFGINPKIDCDLPEPSK